MLIKMRETMRRKDNQKGFTLIELLVVMAILAILAALAIPKFASTQAKAKRDADNSNCELIAHAAETYYDANNGTIDSSTSIEDLITKGYLKENPTDQVTGTTTAYSITWDLTADPPKVTISPGTYDADGNGPTEYPYTL